MALHITPEELSTLQLLAAGKTRSEIASWLETSERDLEPRLSALFARMGVATTGEAVNDALRRGLLTQGNSGDGIGNRVSNGASTDRTDDGRDLLSLVQ